ncbi:MAG TPA: hypothetical protein VLA33_09325 [Gemmatimonadota bacterium]|nr:hypothetical protein [Gemmatimonadota bacterium]
MNAEKLTSVVPEAVRQLLEQRSTYREWLSRLDEVGGKYRTEVAERVRVDYEARLDGVGEKLAEHRHDLAASLERRRARLDELTEAFERHSAELEEAELRFQVGEFDDATWEETREKLAESVEGIEGELDEARSAVGELERVLGELGGGNGSGGSAAPDRTRAMAPAAAAEASDTSGAGEGVAADAAPDAGVSARVEARDEAAEADESTGADEVVVAAEVAEVAEAEADVTADAEVAAQVGSATERTSDAPDGGSEDYLDELEFLESLSLDDPDSFDAVSRMLEDEEDR